MRTRVKKWGNSASVRIPSSVFAAVAFHIDQEVEVREESGRIVIEPVVMVPVYDLSALLEAMSPDTFHDQVDFGAPVGREVW